MLIQKLDNRFRGHEFFEFAIVFRVEEIPQFVTAREWCWETMGPSTELENHWVNTNHDWAWECNVSTVRPTARIYLKSNKELVYFNLKWL